MTYRLVKWADALYHTVVLWADKHLPFYDVMHEREGWPWICDLWERMNAEDDGA